MHAQQSLHTDCLFALHSWFCHNSLALNSSKSESILIGTRQRLRTFPPVASPTIAGIPIPFSETIKMLGVTLDQNLTSNKHVPHYCAVSISTLVHCVTLGLPCRSLWPQLWAHLWCNPTTPTPLCMECQHLTRTNYSLPRSLLLVWFCLLFAIFQKVSTTEYSSKSLHLLIRPWQPVSRLISAISSNYSSHHDLSVLQPSNYSKYHVCLQILVGAPSATALLQHEIPFLLPSKISRPYIVSSATYGLIS